MATQQKKVSLQDRASDLFMKGKDKELSDNDYEDPTYFGFELKFDFNNVRQPASGLSSSPLFGDLLQTSESAEKYLRNIGAESSADHILNFKNNMHKIQHNAPYYFQSIDGLKPLWGPAEDKFDPFYAKDIILTVGCLESIDLLITSTLDSYRKASFDMRHMRRILPENLRQFGMTITISEMRKFNTIINVLQKDFVAQTRDQTLIQKLETNASLNTLKQHGSTLLENGRTFLKDGNSLIESKINDAKKGFEVKPDVMDLRSIDGYASFMVFRLDMCEFMVNESFPVDGINMGTGTFDQIKQQFKIKVGKVTETSYYNLLGYIASSDRDREFGSFLSRQSQEGLFNADSEGRFVKEFQIGTENLHTPGMFENHYTGVPQLNKSRLGQAVDQLVGKVEGEALSTLGNLNVSNKAKQLYMGNVYNPNMLLGFLDRNQYLVNLGKLALS